MLNSLRRLGGRAAGRGLPISPRLGREVAWVVAPFGFTQLLRLGSNIVLTRLLAPEVFGLMLLVNTLRTGTELLSDIGIGQSVVRSPNGEDRRFLDAAWTLQLLRGAILTVVALIAAVPISHIYNRPELAPLIMAVSPVFLLTGMQSPGIFLAQRRMQLARRASYDVIFNIINAALAIGLAFLIPTVWALIIALVAGTAVQTVLSYLVFDRRMPRIVWDHAHASEIFAFGKWIFLSTAIYFAAISFDRLFFVGALTLAMAGVYSVARTFSDILAMLSQRAGAFLVFPRVAAMQGGDPSAGPRLRATRRKTLALVALATGCAIAGADQLILLAYDQRYHGAAFMVPLLMVAVWFGILSSFADSMLMGRGRPAPGAAANGVKFAVLLIGLPLATAQGSMLLALGVLILAEIARWLALAWPSHQEGFAKPFDDVQLTVLMAITAVGAKFVAGSLGLAPTIGEWWAMGRLVSM